MAERHPRDVSAGNLFSAYCLEAGAEFRAFVERRLSRMSSRFGVSEEEIDKTARVVWEAHCEFAPRISGRVGELSCKASIPPWTGLASLGYSDFVDLVASRHCHAPYAPEDGGCTSIAFPASPDCRLPMAAQTWDMTAWIGEYVAVFCCVEDDALSRVFLSPVGGLAHIGLNEQGLFVGTNNVASRDCGVGLYFCAIIDEILASCGSARQAEDVLRTAPRVSGHHYLFADSTGDTRSVEVTAHHIASLPCKQYVLHTNHYLAPSLDPFGIRYSPTSEVRLQAAFALAAELKGGDPVALARGLGRHESPICQHAESDWKPATLKAIVAAPGLGEMWVSSGAPCEGKLVRYRVTNDGCEVA